MNLSIKQLQELKQLAVKKKLTSYEKLRLSYLDNLTKIHDSEFEELNDWYKSCLEDLNLYLGGGGE
jgi:hypothetical protein